MILHTLKHSEKHLSVHPLLAALVAGRLHDPFSYLGVHRTTESFKVRVFRPDVRSVWIRTVQGFEAMQRIHDAGVFEWQGTVQPSTPVLLKLEVMYQAPDVLRVYEAYDPYSFPLQITDHDLYLFNEGKLYQAYRTLGVQRVNNSGVDGLRFSVWAPNAERVSVVGDFNRWDGRAHSMAAHHSSGVWELFIPELPAGSFYKFEIRNRHNGEIQLKADPYATRYELRPGTAALTPVANGYFQWHDAKWMEKRADKSWLHAPVNILEIHAGSWKRHPDGRFYSYRELAQHLLPYVLEMGFTHIELMPISEHPFDESWGYQTTGYFAASSRYGSPEDLKMFVDSCHQADIGVILDWVPGHFPQDIFALARFDGTALYEHEDPRLGFHQDWGTFIFNYGRNEVKSFLLSSAHYWLSEFHFDGLRVDAVASMLYLDYSRKEGEWVPNRYGGRENLEAVDFLRELNIMVHDEFPGAMTFAEESTSWPAVSRPVYTGGLGFSMKWNLGWMHDTLSYMQLDPVYRCYHHDQLTFGQLYAYTENFVLPFSHDEVVHGKGSLFNKMPGDDWQKYANLRLLFTYQMTFPGKKLNFMGNDFAQQDEWQINRELSWKLLENRPNLGIQAVLHDLNHLYKNTPALHELDFSADGFAWIDCHDAEHSIISYLRRAKNGCFVVVILNFTPMPRENYRIGVPAAGIYQELFNSDSVYYGGSNTGNAGQIFAGREPWMGLPCSLRITLPPLAGLIFSLQG
ncbi:1,4-alpha-glucan branching enzyme [Nitrosomonas marina]|uniref:1,4-alpha-glucan branching enzyme GlgB n=1 Tax=Nitrosomonas marina TaxID=917 RepID=A0A1I0AFY0_9PROT|nr:1,4-alpha-glucan branching protein GlgB [Nitrosomonas marina]SES93079.1 1,4-alpha-glucan branching enzyme [Nitrosomonas marina]